MVKRSALKDSMARVRVNAIIAAVNHLLATKGYDQMTVDEVAAEAGLAKASLYKLFNSKEALAGAAMVRALDKALELVNSLRATDGVSTPRHALGALKAVAHWAMLTQLEGEMPSLPSQDSTLSASLKSNDGYVDRLIQLSLQLGTWITEAQTGGLLNAKLPPELLLYNLFACACNPVLGLMKDSGQHSNEQIAHWMLTSLFDGMRPLAGQA